MDKNIRIERTDLTEEQNKLIKGISIIFSKIGYNQAVKKARTMVQAFNADRPIEDTARMKCGCGGSHFWLQPEGEGITGRAFIAYE